MMGLFVLAFLVLAVIIGPYLYTGTQLIDFARSLEGPSPEHLMGTDDLGRDLLGRVLNGGRISIAVGLTAVFIAITLGTTVGAIAGYFGKLDNPLMRITDLFLSLPVLPLLLVLVYLFRETLKAIFGPELGIFLMIVFVIGILNWMPVARLVRASFLSLKQKEFVEVARPPTALVARRFSVSGRSSLLATAAWGPKGPTRQAAGEGGAEPYDGPGRLCANARRGLSPRVSRFLSRGRATPRRSLRLASLCAPTGSTLASLLLRALHDHGGARSSRKGARLRWPARPPCRAARRGRGLSR